MTCNIWLEKTKQFEPNQTMNWEVVDLWILVFLGTSLKTCELAKQRRSSSFQNLNPNWKKILNSLTVRFVAQVFLRSAIFFLLYESCRCCRCKSNIRNLILSAIISKLANAKIRNQVAFQNWEYMAKKKW